MAFISVLLQIFWQKFYWNVSGVVLYQSYEFCPNHWFWLVAVATKRLNFLACNIYSILSEYSLHSCTFRWALWPVGLWFLHFSFSCTFLRSCEAYKVETWYTRGPQVGVLCIPKSSYCCLLVPLFLHFSFSPIFFLSKISQERLHLGFWNLVQMLGMTCCIV